MKPNPITQIIILILLSYLFLFLISYSTFLQIPIILGENLVWQSVIEQSITWIPFVIGFSLLFQKIKKIKKIKKPIIRESRFLLPSFVLIFFSGLSIGVHITSQIIEDVLNNQTSLFAYKLTFFMDEQIGHLFIFPSILLSLIIGFAEVNRKKPKLNKINRWIINLAGFFTGLFSGILSVEAGVIYFLFIPVIILAFYKYFKFMARKSINILDYPFNRYLIISIYITTIFSIIWWCINGFIQPEQMGLELIYIF